MKQYQGSVIVVNDTKEILDNIPFKDGEQAEKKFLDLCKNYIPNFDKYTDEDIDIILENGYDNFGIGLIAINWFV